MRILGRLGCTVIAVCMLANSSWAAAAEPAPKRLLLLGNRPDGHPKSTHEYVPGLKLLARLLSKTPGLETTLVAADEPWTQGPEQLREADGVVLFLTEGARWTQADPRRADALAALAQRGGGISALHWGTGTKEARNIEPFLKLVGACHGGPDRRYKVVDVEAHLADPGHSVSAGLQDFRVRDEFYYSLKRAPGIRPLLEVPIEGERHTVAWTWERPGGGRSFGFTGLHFHKNWSLPEYRRLVAQGVLWSLGLPIRAEGLDVAVSDAELALE